MYALCAGVLSRGLRWPDIDLDQDVIRVSKTLHRINGQRSLGPVEAAPILVASTYQADLVLVPNIDATTR